ncbi:MAG: hypothetical protein R2693_05855 [Nocardioidaceae bacterium]
MHLAAQKTPPTGCRRHGALLFPKVPDLPFDPYRAHLYTGPELYAGLGSSYDIP